MKLQLSIYLLKQGCKPDDVLSERGEGATLHTVSISEELTGVMRTTRTWNDAPSWLGFFSDRIQPWPDLGTGTYGALLLLEASGRLWGLTFGTLGRHLLNDAHIEPRFGLKTTLSAVKPDSLRGFDAQKFDEVFRKVVEHAAADAETHHFGWDVERDLIQAVVGRPADPSVGEIMAGADKLSVKGKFSLDKLPELLAKLLDLYRSQKYKKQGFDWVDKIEPVSDSDTIALLELELVDVMLDPARRNLVAFALPGALGLGDEVKYAFNKKAEYYMLSVADVAQELGTSWDADRLKGKRITVEDQDGTSTTVRLFDCLLAQLDYAPGTTHLLSGGKWFAVSPSWVGEVDDALKRLPKRTMSPDFNPGEHRERKNGKWVASEAKWCEAAAKDLIGAAVLDRTLVYIGGGHSSIEFADIFDGTLIVHAKRYHSSGSLSHLFAQARASAEGWCGWDPEFRVLVNGILPAKLRLKDPNRQVSPSAHTIVLACIAASEPLPFLSRVNLKSLFEALQKVGYKVEIAYVPEVSFQNLKTKVPPTRKRKT